MSQDDPELSLLGDLGRVPAPDPAVLDAAREVLWSAVAQQMLSDDPSQQPHHRHQTGQPHQADRRHRA
jgi:hypothetical protein